MESPFGDLHKLDFITRFLAILRFLAMAYPKQASSLLIWLNENADMLASQMSILSPLLIFHKNNVLYVAKALFLNFIL